MPGNYLAETDRTIEHLTLRTDHSFTQEVFNKELKNQTVVDGNWRFRGGDLEFSKFITTYDGDGDFDPDYEKHADFVTLLSADYFWNEIHIRVNDYHSYKRVGP